MKKFLLASALCLATLTGAAENPKVYIAFQWHMHQPIYNPGETVLETHQSGVMDYNLLDVFTSRTGAYTSWPANAVKKLIAADLPGGAQVSFSGTLVENLNVLEADGKHFKNWKQSWLDMIGQKTALGNQRLDMVGFGYYHPLMALIDEEDARNQIRKHRECFEANFPGMPYSKGIFPPENAFESHMIPALVKEGLEWVMVDNMHFDRAAEGFGWMGAIGEQRPNQADILNPNPGDWQHVDGMYCPGSLSAGWGHRPHWVKYVDPADGKEYRMIAVPTSYAYGNEDGRGGFGALQYEKCISQIERWNTDPEHPILVVLHHDGDNHGGGSEGYYTSNFSAFVNWLKANPDRFECTTIQDYLDRFPPADNDVIHVESGSWWGAGADPEFKKWNGDKGTYKTATEPYSPDHNSWGIITAAANHVKTAAAINPNDATVKQAWSNLMLGETSCYWYWDGDGQWDSKPAQAANMAVNGVKNIIAAGQDKTGPSIYHPQREPYNPGSKEFDEVMPSDFTVWTYVYDLSGLSSVKVKYRIDKDGKNPISSIQNETFAGGNEVGEWKEVAMTPTTIASITDPQPLYKAEEYSAKITGLKEVLVDYYVEAIDKKGNVANSQILHVYVGDGKGSNAGGGGGSVTGDTGSYIVTPVNPTRNDEITIVAPNGQDGIILHWGVDNFIRPNEAYLPEGSQYHNDGKAARTPFYRNSEGKMEVKIGPFNNPVQEVSYISFVTNTGSSWDNNSSKNYKIALDLTNGVSVPAIETEDNVEYYNLQGIRVSAPEHGIFIRRIGKNVSKIMLP